MSGSTNIRAQYEPLRSLASGSISGTYAKVGTPLAHPTSMVYIWNNTDADLLISYDGINDHSFQPTKAGRAIDYGSDKADKAGELRQAAGTQIYVKQASGAATTGSVYFEIIYAAN